MNQEGKTTALPNYYIIIRIFEMYQEKMYNSMCAYKSAPNKNAKTTFFSRKSLEYISLQ